MKLAVRGLLGVVGLLWSLFGATTCGLEGVGEERKEGPLPDKIIQQVLSEHTDSLMSLPGVVGTAQGECEGDPCIRVLVVEKTSELLGRIPSAIEGYTVDVVETGEIKALDPG